MNIEERLAKLERDIRQWRRIAICLSAAILVFVGFRQIPGPITTSIAAAAEPAALPKAELVRTNGIEIVNSRNEVVALFKAREDGAILTLNAPDRKSSVTLLASKDLGICKVLGGNGQSFLSDESLSISPIDPVKRSMQQEIEKKVSEGILVADEASKQAYNQSPAVSIGLTEGSKGGSVEVYNPFGKIVGTIQSNKVNSGQIAIYDVNGNNPRFLALPGR